MKKSILGICTLTAATSAFAFTTWYGDKGVYQIDTGFDAGTETSGHWFIYADDADGGTSTIQWPVSTFDANDDLSPIIDYCAGVCGKYTLGKGSLDNSPFVGIGFFLAGLDENDDPAPVDATAMGGFCIAYSVDDDAIIELEAGEPDNGFPRWDNPYINLPKSSSGIVKEFTWKQFGRIGDQVNSGEAAAKKLISIRFKIQAKDGATGNFNIMSIGAYGGNCRVTENPSAISTKAAQSSLKAKLSGHTLSFGKSVAKAEIVNLQGQIVMTASSVKSMDLSNIQAGVYMVRADGHSKQILVK